MQITIYRGTHQIGGCATEIRTKNTRILIDFGSELPKAEEAVVETLSLYGITEGKVDCDGVFFTHSHGDHIGNIDRVLPGIPMYIGKVAKEILLVYLNHMNRLCQKVHKSFADKTKAIEAIEKINTYVIKKPIVVGDIKVTPYRVDHSSFDSYCLLIEAEGKKILHTGDFRTHGFTGKGFKPVLRYIGKIDCLITEGTLLSRGEKNNVISEVELEYKAKEILKKNNKVFVCCSSTNIDRFAAFHGAAKMLNIPCYCDEYQKDILSKVTEYDISKGGLYTFSDVKSFGYNQKFPDSFLAFVRTGEKFKKIMDMYKTEALVIYSMWEGYLEKETMKNFFDGFEVIKLHTSGHASLSDIKTVLDKTRPELVLPIHIENPNLFQKYFPSVNCLKIADGEVVTI